MIIAAGLTPAWQQILTFSHFQTGEVNRAHSAMWCASGKVLNVGLALHQLGADSRTISFFGGDTGHLMQADFQQQGVSTRWVESKIPTRVCTTILNESTKQTTELVENSRPVDAAELTAFSRAFAEEAHSVDWVVLSGSLPQHTPTDFYAQLISSTQAKVILDIRGEELKACLPAKPYLVKPNREELEKTVGHPLITASDLLSAMRQLLDWGAQRVLISQGPKEIWYLSSQYCLQFHPPQVEAVNPIGCGDCLTAGIAAGLSAGMQDVDAIRFGIAAAVENLQHLLPAHLNHSSVLERMQSIPFLNP